jgi:uncharacterized phiE125 gp8 family phage protein
MLRNCTAWQYTTEPAVEPVTVAELKTYGNLDPDSNTSLLESFITAARATLERSYDMALINRTMVAYWDEFPSEDELILPSFPVSAITSVQYYLSSVLTTWAATNYVTDFVSRPARIVKAYGVTWPTEDTRPNAVVVTATVGFGAAASNVPTALRMAIRAMALDMYENRNQFGDTPYIPKENKAITNLINSYAIPGVG